MTIAHTWLVLGFVVVLGVTDEVSVRVVVRVRFGVGATIELGVGVGVLAFRVRAIPRVCPGYRSSLFISLFVMSNNKTILKQRAEALVSFGISMTERTTIMSCLYWMSLGINQFLLEHEVVFISPPLQEVLVSHICNRMI